MDVVEQFEGWLRKGIGRAAVYLETHDSKPYLNTLLHACIHNLTYDAQCECSREEYLKGLIRATGEETFFRSGLLRVLTGNEIDPEIVDLDQIIAVCRMFAEVGDDEIRDAMYGALARVGFGRAGRLLHRFDRAGRNSCG